MLQSILAEFKLHVLEVTQHHNEELNGRVHREFSKQDWGGSKGEVQLDLMDVKLFKVHFLLPLHLLDFVGLLQFIKSMLHHLDLPHLVIHTQLSLVLLS